MENKSKELIVALEAAVLAGKVLRKHFENDPLREIKEDKSIVTIADKESEEIIKKTIETNFPNHSIFAEETGFTKKEHNYIWHIDPIDGTRNYANGIPYSCLSIALEFENELVIGVVYNPMTESLFYAEKGKGAYWNDKKISVSKENEQQGMVTVSSSKNINDYKLFKELLYVLSPDTIRSVRDFGCAALNLAYVARGGLEAEIQLGLHSFDFAAGVLLVQEAGGKITKLDGSEWKFPEARFIASNGVFHDLIISEIKKQKEKLNI